MKERRDVLGLALSVLLAVAMAVVMAPARAYAQISASSTANITVNGLTAGDSVRIYKVVDANYDEGTNAVTYAFTGDYGLTMDKYEALENDSDGMKAAADQMASKVSTGTPTQTATAAGDSVTFSNLSMGQYLVLVTGASNETVYQNTIVSLVPTVENGDFVLSDATATMKKEPVTITKTVDGADSTDAYALGDKVPFTITSTVPVYPDNATDTTFTISDVETAGLTFDDDVTITAGTAKVPLTAGTDYTLTKTDDGFKITFDYAKVKAYAGQNVTVSYTATINAAAVVTTPETNTATLEFATNPYDANSHKTKDTPSKVYTYGVYLKKVDKDGGAPLADAEFAVYKADPNGTVTLEGKQGTYRLVGTIKTGSDGYGAIDDLGAGTYCMKETKAPSGYVLSDSVWEFTVSKDAVDATGTYANYYNAGTVQDVKTPGLAYTGDAGTFALTVTGCAAMVAGVVALVASRRLKG